MNAPDFELANMIRELAGMNAADRDFVLGKLGVDEASRLAPYMQLSPSQPLSAEMRSLGAGCAEGQVPGDITPLAAAAIEAAFAGFVPEARIDAALEAPRRISLRSVISDFGAGR